MEPKVMLKKIDHINIVTTDIESAKNFFIKLLGVKIVAESMLEGNWIDNVVGLPGVKAKFAKLTIPNTQTNIEIVEYFSPKGSKDSKISVVNQIGLRHLAFEVKDIEQVYVKLKSAGVKFYSEIQTHQNKKLCYFHGPDSIILELAEYIN